MPSLDRDQQDVDIDLAQFFRAVWQRKGTFLTATALVGVLAFVGAHAIAPTYKSDAMLLIEPREPSFSASGPNARRRAHARRAECRQPGSTAAVDRPDEAGGA